MRWRRSVKRSLRLTMEPLEGERLAEASSGQAPVFEEEMLGFGVALPFPKTISSRFLDVLTSFVSASRNAHFAKGSNASYQETLSLIGHPSRHGLLKTYLFEVAAKRKGQGTFDSSFAGFHEGKRHP